MLALGKAHSNPLLEEACAKALLLTPRPSYKIVKAIVADLAKKQAEGNNDDHAYLRGSDYYKSIDENYIDDDNDGKGKQ